MSSSKRTTSQTISAVTLLTLLTFTLFAVGVRTAHAATINVTNLNDSGAGSLRDAVSIAANGDTINIVPTGTLYLTSGQISINKSLTITGTNRQSLFINGNDNSRIFEIRLGATVVLNGMTLEHGKPKTGDSHDTQGGAIYVVGTLTINDGALNNNISADAIPYGGVAGGGAIYNIGTVQLRRTVLASNVAVSYDCGEGGAIFNAAGATFGAFNSTFYDNYAGGIQGGLADPCGSGGAIYNLGTTNITTSLLHGNQARYSGAIDSRDTLNLTNTTVYQNTTLLYSSTAAITITGTATLKHVTVYQNNATTTLAVPGGIKVYAGSTLNLQNSIVAGNTYNGTTNRDMEGAFTSLGYNLVQTRTGSSGYIASDLPDGTNPALAALADNGGQTKTLALNAGSPAIDVIMTTGGCNNAGVTADQRGVTRPVGVRCDIGAYEAGATLPTLTPTVTRVASSTPTSTSTSTPTSTPVPFTGDFVGIYKDGVFSLRTSTESNATLTVLFGGDPSDLPVVGDWNGDGLDTVGVYRSSTGFFYLSNSNTAPGLAYNPLFGNPGDKPFAGRWTNDMTGSGIGVYRDSNGILYQRKSLTNGFNDFFAVFGNPGDQPIAGDWDGNGYDSIGIYRPGNQTWYLTNNSTPGGITFADTSFAWTTNGSIPFAGDWNGDGTSTIGYYDSDHFSFVLHSANATAGTDTTFGYGTPGNKPVAGKWILPAAPRPMSILGNSSGGFANPDTNGNGD